MWHPECSEINKTWSVKPGDLIAYSAHLSPAGSWISGNGTYLGTVTPEDAKSAFETAEEHIRRVSSVLSNHLMSLFELYEDLAKKWDKKDVSGVVDSIELLIRFVCVLYEAIDKARISTRLSAGDTTFKDKDDNFNKFESVLSDFARELRDMTHSNRSARAFKVSVKKGIALVSKLVEYAESMIRIGLQFCASINTSNLLAGVSEYLDTLENWKKLTTEQPWALQKYRSQQLSRSARCVCNRIVDEACFISQAYGRTLYWHPQCPRCTTCDLSDLGPVATDGSALSAPGIACQNCHEELVGLEFCSQTKLELLSVIVSIGELQIVK
ncbi:hypothetical protein G7Z17_g4721 [Cylindrodendrum hubeiense]|uniref:Uncharacterized protein n=1 Tax=Cylindrodendrum hubeiense TaxID=595255 RepID=A0A9P5LGX5_9HYPO|nr:hypothetical protein G7Z17_g4721 [Cylindrodendrum hubeiense]